MLLNGKTALVYGAGGAVGGAVSRAFAREGAHLILAGRTAAPLERTATAIRDAGGRAEVTLVDAFDARAVEAHLARSAADFGRVHVMFNSVGWDDVQGRPLTEMTGPEVIDVVTRAVTTWFHTGTAAARQMASLGGGVILGITAIPARVHLARVGGFGIACAAVENLLRQLAFENGPAGVRVCFVRSAGSPDTPGLDEVFAKQAKTENKTVAQVKADYAARSPLRRLPLLAEVADAAVLLASDYARSMTATLANVTCGAYVD
jgi:NAD(P)-dependent dehydrogenase (short-subunit alcohol dehydrogenase family)